MLNVVPKTFKLKKGLLYICGRYLLFFHHQNDTKQLLFPITEGQHCRKKHKKITFLIFSFQFVFTGR